MPDPVLDSLKQAEKSASDQARVKIQRAGDLIPYVSVLDPEGEALQKMEPWPLALELVNEFWPAYRRTVCLKARQLGVSWDFALYCLFHCGWSSFRTVGSVNYTKEESAKLVWRMKVLWQTLPEWLKPRVDWSTERATFANGSRVISLATTDVAGAGDTFSLMGIDEAGLIKTLGDNWAALLPAVEKGALHVFSTPRDAVGKFAELVGTCREHNRILTREKRTLAQELKPGSFVMRDIDYDERPDRDQSTPEGRAWKAARIEELGQKGFAREYLKEFQRPGECFFDDDTIKDLRANAKAARESLWRGSLKIWERPQPGQSYVIGADVAEGLADGDYSAASVMNRRTGVEVAKFHAHLGVTDYAEALVKLAKMFGKAWLAIEANNHGHAVCAWVYHHLKYRRVYRESREDEGQLQGPSRFRLGILNTSSSKPAMLAELEDGLRKGTIRLFDSGTIEELATYLHLPNGGYGGAPGCHDDRVIALMLAQNGRGRAAPRAI